MIQNPINAFKITVYNAKHTKITKICFPKSTFVQNKSKLGKFKNEILFFYYISNSHKSSFYTLYICTALYRLCGNHWKQILQQLVQNMIRDVVPPSEGCFSDVRGPIQDPKSPKISKTNF